MTKQWRADEGEPTRALDPQPNEQDADWFWSRPQQDEPTQVLGVSEASEQTVQLPLAMSAAIGSAAASASAGAGQSVEADAFLVDGASGHAAPNHAAPNHAALNPAPSFAPPSGPPAAQFPAAQFPAAQFPTLPGAYPAGQPAPTSGRSSGRTLLAVFAASVLAGTAILQAPGLMSSSSSQPEVQQPGTQAGGTQTGGTGQQEQGSSPVPAEGQPWDPWQQESDGSGDTQEQSASTGGQTTATSAQSKGVVLITTTTAAGQGAGSGMIVTTNGYVLTNYHVVQSSTRVQVQVASTKRTYTATVVGHDASNDVALLKLEGADNLETVTIDDDGLKTGDTVTAVGNANGQGYLSAASGTVKDLASSITVTNESSAAGSERLSDVIKTNAGAQPGDSGGPMLDVEGEVVGMTTAGQTASSGIRTQNTTIASYAVPIERAMGIIKQIQSGQESGSVKVGPKAYLGVSVRSLDDGSLMVASVVSGGPAQTAGLSQGDVITSIDGVQVGSQASLSEQLTEHEPGDRVVVGWYDAQGKIHRQSVTLGSSPVN